MDWNLIRSYLMVAEHGSSLAAAQHLDITQSTVSRHLSQLESQLSVQLFDRRKTGLVLTDKGRELLGLAKQMDSIADALQAKSAHYSSTVSGSIRISASEMLAVAVVPKCLDKVLSDNPELQIEIVSSNDASNLLDREADIALRMFPPSQQDLIAKHLLDIPVGFYASKDYLKRHGTPEKAEDFSKHEFIGFDASTLFIDGAKQMGFRFKKNDFHVRTDSTMVQRNCAVAGLGLAILQDRLTYDEPQLQAIDIGLQLPAMPLYLVAQQELKVSRKLRVVYDALADALLAFYQRRN